MNKPKIEKHVEIFTDGACSGNPGRGGWGAILRYKGKEKEIGGGEPETTNNRMELMAAIRALETLKESCRIDLYTDSQYVQQGLKEWLPKWRANGWKTANRKPVKNQDLWEELDRLSQKHSITWHWIRGHAGHPENERADELARRHMPQI